MRQIRSHASILQTNLGNVAEASAISFMAHSENTNRKSVPVINTATTLAIKSVFYSPDFRGNLL